MKLKIYKINGCSIKIHINPLKILCFPLKNSIITAGKYINCYNKLGPRSQLMYKFERYHQLGLADFNQPVGLKMNLENRWIKKAEKVFGDTIDKKY